MLSGADDVAVLLNDASMTLNDTTWIDNGEDLVQQACAGRPSPADITGANASICPASDRMTHHMDFDFSLLESAAASE